MGVPSVWDITKKGFDERLPFSVLVTNFYKEHGRPIRIAIDAYQWIFEAGSVAQAANLPFSLHTGRLIQSFHSRIKEMISLNVSFVFVFDGQFKPNFKRNIDMQKEQSFELESRDYDTEFLKFKELSEKNGSFYHINDFKEVAELKEELDRWNISYVDAPSEGEAEASRLQTEGIVDYVLSNDSDTIIFGATKILRNFSKFVEDKPAGAIGCKSQEEFWCTPVDMEKVTLKTGFDQWRVLLFSILKGADYNTGVRHIGTEKAFQIALSSTQFMTHHIASCPYEKFPDFSSMLRDIFQTPPSQDSLDEDSKTRKQNYELFKSDVFDHVRANLLEYFGRNEKYLVKDGKFENFPPDYVVRLYFHPLLRKDLFQFKDGMTNFAETEDPQKWIDLPEFGASLDYFRKNPPPNVTDVEIWYIRTLSEAYLLRSVIYDLDIPATIEKMKTKNLETFDIDLLSVRFKYSFPFGEIEDSDDAETKKTKKGPLKWVPKDLVPVSSKHYLEYLEKERQAMIEEEEKNKQAKKRSPRKKPTQTTTLTSLGFIDAPSKEIPVQRIQRRKSSDVGKQSINILDMLKAKTLPVSQKIPEIPSPVKKKPLFVTDSDLESDDESSVEEVPSPEKAVKASPTKIQTEMKSAVQESPIKVKSRKQGPNTSPSKGNRTYKLEDLENDETNFPSAKKKLDFTAIQSSTPTKKNLVNNLKETTATEDVTMVTISDTSMVNDSSLMEISRIEESPKPTLKKFSALDDILKPIDFSSDDSD